MDGPTQSLRQPKTRDQICSGVQGYQVSSRPQTSSSSPAMPQWCPSQTQHISVGPAAVLVTMGRRLPQEDARRVSPACTTSPIGLPQMCSRPLSSEQRWRLHLCRGPCRGIWTLLCLGLLIAGGGTSVERCPQMNNGQRNYSGYKVLQVVPRTQKQVHQLQTLHNFAQNNFTVDFWSNSGRPNAPIDLMVSPEVEQKLRKRLQTWRMHAKTLVRDLGKAIASSQSRPPNGKPFSGKGNRAQEFFREYQPLAEIEARLKGLASDSRVTIERPARSIERRHLYLVKVSTNRGAQKPIILIDAGHHAREWITHSSVIYLLEALVKGRQLPVASSRWPAPLLGDLLDRYDFWFVPVVNPDGYEWSRTRDRLWRKNRRRPSQKWSHCFGVDLNRNYDFGWTLTEGEDACGETYGGLRALSEPETSFMAALLRRHGKRIRMYVSLHAYGQMMVLPYGSSYEYPPNYWQMMRVAEKGAEAIRQLRGSIYRSGTAAHLLYIANGCSDDFAYGVAKVPFVYTIELSDGSFILPVSEIVPVGHELAVGLRAMVEAIGGRQGRPTLARSSSGANESETADTGPPLRGPIHAPLGALSV